MAGLYLHIPFCKQACYYCDFHFSTDPHRQVEMTNALIQEIELQKEFIKAPLQTVYLGGGTPSLLHAKDLGRLFHAIRSTFSLASEAEITLEANPDDLTPKKLDEFGDVGINRLSIGIQSFDDALLHYLHRAHDAAAAHQCLKDVAAAGFTNISLDLIYAIPGLSLELWETTLKKAISYQPTHLSAYSLTIEEKTVFGHWKKKGKLTLVDEEPAAKQFELLQSVMDISGFEQYEISNFCRPGHYSRHNSNYWKQEPYLGIGPSAHSYDGSNRYFNVKNNALYVKSLAEGRLPVESEHLTSENKINEYILTRLRTTWGCDLQFLQDSLNDDLLARRGSYIDLHLHDGLLTLTNRVLRLTRKGKLLADKITEDLMV